MSTTQELAIRLERFIKAPAMDVWRAITDPKKFFATFVGINITGELIAGQLCAVDDGFAFVEEATPGKRLAVRVNYDPEVAKTFKREESTLVVFELIEQDGGTLLKFSETEFENLPEAIRQQSFDQVNAGWPEMIVELGDLVERGDDAWLFAQSYGLINAPVEKLWEAATQFKVFDQLKGFEGKIEVGSQVILDFGGENGRIPILITNVVPNQELAFRWHHDRRPPADTFDEAETTLVRFQMFPYEGGAYVILRESEFDRLPAETRRTLHEEQSQGWSKGIEQLTKIVTGEKA